MTTALGMVGLAVGIGIVVLFVVIFSAVETMPQDSLDIEIAGLKE